MHGEIPVLHLNLKQRRQPHDGRKGFSEESCTSRSISAISECASRKWQKYCKFKAVFARDTSTSCQEKSDLFTHL